MPRAKRLRNIQPGEVLVEEFLRPLGLSQGGRRVLGGDKLEAQRSEGRWLSAPNRCAKKSGQENRSSKIRHIAHHSAGAEGSVEVSPPFRRRPRAFIFL